MYTVHSFVRALVAEMPKTTNDSEGDGSHEPFLSRPPAGRLSQLLRTLTSSRRGSPSIIDSFLFSWFVVAVESLEYSHDHAPLHLLLYPLDAGRLRIHISVFVRPTDLGPFLALAVCRRLITAHARV